MKRLLVIGLLWLPAACGTARAEALTRLSASTPGGAAIDMASLAAQPTRPHPSVARIIVPERRSTSYGSGTLVDVHDRYGLVVTNWHVVSDAAAAPTVVFPDGFQSAAQVVKVDRDWDLAALAIWKPNAGPVPLAQAAPRPGEMLAIAGYGQGPYRLATGRCTQYLAPGMRFPQQMVELAASARQGDSGGPILNSRGELAGVLWGEGGGRTTGSYCGRVRSFLASVLPSEPDLPHHREADETMLAQAAAGAPRQPAYETPRGAYLAALGAHAAAPARARSATATPDRATVPQTSSAVVEAGPLVAVDHPADDSEGGTLSWKEVAGHTRWDQAKTILAAIGALAVVLQGRRLYG